MAIPIPNSIQSALNRFNIGSYDPFFDRYNSQWAVIAQRNQPSGPEPADCSFYPFEIAAHLVARGILYFKNTPGDCGTPSRGGSSAIAGLQLSSQGLGAASSIAAGVGSGLSVGLGAATAGFGLLIAPIIALIQHHGVAVANEQSAICNMASASLQAIPQIDTLVSSGKFTAAQGVQALQQIVAQLKGIVAGVSGAGSGGHPCNAGCCYQAILDAHVDFAQIYYKDISPMQILPMPAIPTGVSLTQTTAVPQQISDWNAPVYGSPQIAGSPVMAYGAMIPAVGTFPWTFILIAIAALGLVIWIARK